MAEIPIIPPEEMISREEMMKPIEKKESKADLQKLEEAMKGWRFSDKAIKQMKNLSNKSKTVGLEYGSLLCGNTKTKKIDLSSECVGTGCKIRIEHTKCPKNTTQLGDFHTHPEARISHFSPPDIYPKGLFCLGTPNAVEENEKLVCIVPTTESLKPERLERRENELFILKLKNFVEDKYKRARDIDRILEDDYHTFNPEEYNNDRI